MKFIKQLIFAVVVFISSIAGAFAAQDTILASAVRATTTTSSDIVRTTERVIHVVIKTSAVPGVDTITPKIQGMDSLGNYYDLLVGSAISTTGTVVLKVGPGLGVIAAGAAADMIPDVYRVVITHSAGTNFTYTVAINKMN